MEVNLLDWFSGTSASFQAGSDLDPPSFRRALVADFLFSVAGLLCLSCSL